MSKIIIREDGSTIQDIRLHCQVCSEYVVIYDDYFAPRAIRTVNEYIDEFYVRFLGDTYVFCGRSCVHKFKINPLKYINEE